MKRRSVVGPMVLILLGAAFLINNVKPDLNLFSFAANYWPFLLIAIGVLRLMEVLAYAASSKPLPPKGLGGGEIFALAIALGGLAPVAGVDGACRNAVRGEKNPAVRPSR